LLGLRGVPGILPKTVLGTVVLNPHPFADEIKCHPEVETLAATRDNCAEVMRKVLGWLTVEGKVQKRGQKATSIIAEEDRTLCY
jgi:hypothetical protein